MVTVASRTVARAIAGADVRNAISTMIAWLFLLTLGIPFNDLLNFDATQFMLDGFGQARLEVWVCRNDKDAAEFKKKRRLETRPSKKNHIQSNNAPDLAISIKWYAMIHSDEMSGPMVLVVADKRMTSDACKIYPVNGLHPTGDPTLVGYIVFCQSLSPPRSFSTGCTATSFLN